MLMVAQITIDETSCHKQDRFLHKSRDLPFVNSTSMYKYDRTITLVTIASPLNQNLALLDPNEYVIADTLACIHEGYINVIPILNADRRCKYVPLNNDKNRGKGLIKQIKWVRLAGETIFVVTSTAGLQIYDAELCDVRFFHACRAHGGDMNYTNGICVVQNNTLCIGTNLGTVWMFKGDENNSNFKTVDIFHAHEEAITLLDGMGKYLVSSSGKITYLWSIQDKQFEISRQIYVPGLFSTPTVLKVSSYLIFIGYESGEFCIFDIFNPPFLIRTVAHKLKITGLDFSVLKHLSLTASEDCYIKIWTFNESSTEGLCTFSTFNESGPLCGAAFLNYNCTELCAVTANDISVNVYIKQDE